VLPIKRPRLGLSVTSQTLSLVELHRPWRQAGLRPAIRRYQERVLPDGLLRDSALQCNITDVEMLAREIDGLLGSRPVLTSVRPVALTLPDPCARIALFDFDAWPLQPSEQDALLRWRFQEDLHLKAVPADYRVVRSVFPRSQSSERAMERTDNKPVRVLAAAMRQDILAQYEQACLAAGLLHRVSRPSTLRPVKPLAGGRGPEQ